jgi:hypothetical protein
VSEPMKVDTIRLTARGGSYGDVLADATNQARKAAGEKAVLIVDEFVMEPSATRSPAVGEPIVVIYWEATVDIHVVRP